MLAICDVNEYRKCVKELGVADVEQLFDVLHSLCNLLVVVPENLRQVSSGELLVRSQFTQTANLPPWLHCAHVGVWFR